MGENSRTGGKKVGLFATCLVDLIRPEVGFASARLIKSSGFKVHVPKDQTCCGQPLFNSGDFKGAKKVALFFLKTFRDFDYVVTPSGSCAGNIKIHFSELFPDGSTEQALAHEVGSKTYELTQFLSDISDCEINSSYADNCTYHDSCAGFRELGIKAQPRQLLSNVKDLTLTECEDSTACCGFGGTFCVKYPKISARIVRDKAENIENTGANTLLGGDLGCLMNIAGTLQRRGTKVRVRHVAEVLSGCSNTPAIGEPQN